MPFVTRPHFEDRQIVQYNEDEIKLSGTSKIAPVILDFTGTTTGSTTVEINGLTGYLNGQRQYGFVVEPAQLRMSGSTGTTTVDVTGYVLASMDSKGSVGWVALSGGPIGNTYVNSGSVVGNDLILNWNTGGSVPAIALPTSTFTGNTSASCITDIYVKNIHSCSPLNIQPNDEGNVYFGSTSGITVDVSGSNLGIGTTTPTEKLHVNGSVRVVGDSILHSDTNTTNPLTGIVKGQYTEFNWDGITGGISSNSATSGSSSYYVGDFSNFPTTRKHGSIRYYGSGYTRSGGIVVPTSFYQNKVLIAGGHDTDGMVIKGKSGDPNGTLCFELNGS